MNLRNSVAGPALVFLTGTGCAFISDADKDWRLDPDGDGVSMPDDCDDGDATIGLPRTFFADADNDGFGDATTEVEACEQPEGTVFIGDDCNDDDSSAYPGASEVWYDGIDSDCAGGDDYDADVDGFATTDGGGDDCDDTDDAIHPGADDTWYDGVDSDCAGDDDYDADVDGYDVDIDCDDTDPQLAPNGEPEVPFNGVDDNCDLSDGDGDRDSDGYWAAEYEDVLATAGISIDVTVPDGERDCWDDPDDVPAERVVLNGFPDLEAADVYPRAADTWYDGVDADCADDADFDADQDGYDTDKYGQRDGSSGDDCIEGLPSDVNPGSVAPALCNPGTIEDEPYDGTDCDCAEDSDYDSDRDGYDSSDHGGLDCDDFDEFISPAELETCDDGVDNDCDGTASECGVEGDLTLLSADASLQGVTTEDAAGGSLAVLGDWDGDGALDLVSGASFADSMSTGAPDAGTAYVWRGPLSGTRSLLDSTTTMYGTDPSDRLGFAVSPAGDLDLDGYDDVAIGAPLADSISTDDGRVYLFFGPTTGGIDALGAGGDIKPDIPMSGLGYAIAQTGDVTGDGAGDLILGAPWWDSAGTGLSYGAVYLWSGPVTGAMDTSLALRIEGSSEGEQTGAAVAGMGDVNGDGVADFAIGSPTRFSTASESGVAYLFYGPVTALASVTSADSRLRGDSENDHLGGALAGAGDLNADGFDDVLFAAPGVSDRAGAVYVLFGPVTGVLGPTDADGRIDGESADDYAGSSLAGDIDVNGDGALDVIVGAPGQDASGVDAGAAYLVAGPVTGTIDLSSAEARLKGTSDGDAAGTSVGAADLNADGYGDILVGASGDDSVDVDAGAVYLVVGGGI